jgi:response regulator RpfG family c-di-GMP phosphodiesterase
VIDQDVRKIPVVLAMPFNIQRKIIASELLQCGFRVFMADTGLRAIELTLTKKPKIVFANFELDDMTGGDLLSAPDAMRATKDTDLALIAARNIDQGDQRSLPKKTIHLAKGTKFAEELTSMLVDLNILV